MTIRVVHVIARLNVGGPAAIIEALIEGAHDEFEHVVLAGTPGRGEVDWRDIRGGMLEARYLSKLSPRIDPYADARAVAQVTRELRRLRPDIIHTHTAKGGMVGRLAARTVPRAKTIHSFHGHVLHGYFSPRLTKAYVSAERQLARRTDRLLSVGERVREELLSAGIGQPAQHCTVAPGIAPLDLPDRAKARTALGLPPDSDVMVILGRLTGVKRVDRALDVFRAVHKDNPDAVLLLAGGGDLELDLRAQATDLSDTVRFLGWVGDVGQVLSAADLILLTSDNEGMPVGLIEAAHAGVPAVATDVGGVAEVVINDETGYVVPVDVTALAAACARLLADPTLRGRMGDMAKRHAKASFAPSILVRRHEDIYRKVLG